MVIIINQTNKMEQKLPLELIVTVLDQLDDRSLYMYGSVSQSAWRLVQKQWKKKCKVPKEPYFETYQKEKYKKVMNVLNQMISRIEFAPEYMKVENIKELVTFYQCNGWMKEEKQFENLVFILEKKIKEFSEHPLYGPLFN